MTATPRRRFWIAAFVALACVGGRDAWQERRDKLARMSAADRARLEERQRRFAELSPGRQRELRDLAAELDAKPTAERASLEAEMRRLAAFVDSMPDALRREYHDATLDSERLKLLTRHRDELDRRAVELAKAMPKLTPKMREFAKFEKAIRRDGPNAIKRLEGQIRTLLAELGTLSGDDETLQTLLTSPDATLADKALILRCLMERKLTPEELDDMSGTPLFERMPPLVRMLEQLSKNVPALAVERPVSLEGKQRRAYWDAIGELYLLSPGSTGSKLAPKKGGLKSERPKFGDIVQQQLLLSAQINLFNAYLRNPARIPAADRPRYEKLTGKKLP
jgi:hypothetical protein